MRQVAHLKDEVSPAGRLPLQPQSGAVLHALGQRDLERLAADADVGGAASEGVQQAHVQSRLGGGRLSGYALRPERLPGCAAEVRGEAAPSDPAEAAEEALEEVGEIAELLRRDGAVGGAAGRPGLEGGHAVGGAVLIVEAALLVVRQHGVRLVDLLEALLGAGVVGVAVRVVLGGELTERAPDVVLARVAGHAQGLVVILVTRHSSPHPSWQSAPPRPSWAGRRCRDVAQPSSSANTVTRATRTRRSPCTKPASKTWSMVPGSAPGLSATTVSASCSSRSNFSPGWPTSFTSSAARLRSRLSRTARTPGTMLEGSSVRSAASSARSRSSKTLRAGESALATPSSRARSTSPSIRRRMVSCSARARR